MYILYSVLARTFASNSYPAIRLLHVCLCKKEPPQFTWNVIIFLKRYGGFGLYPILEFSTPLDCDLAVRNFSLFDEADVLG